MRRVVVLGSVLVIGFLGVAFEAAQGQAPRATLPDLVKVKDNLYVIGASSPADRSMSSATSGLDVWRLWVTSPAMTNRLRAAPT